MRRANEQDSDDGGVWGALSLPGFGADVLSTSASVASCAAAGFDPSVMSEKYWAIWSDDVQQKIDADIEANRKANGAFAVDASVRTSSTSTSLGRPNTTTRTRRATGRAGSSTRRRCPSTGLTTSQNQRGLSPPCWNLTTDMFVGRKDISGRGYFDSIVPARKLLGI